MFRCIGIVVALAAASSAARAENGILGLWVTPENLAHVDIQACDNGPHEYCGRVVWMLEPLDENGEPKTDVRNSDESLRHRPLMGIETLWITPDDDREEWSGEVYIAGMGRMARARLRQEQPDELAVRGCIFLLFCQTQTWIRLASEEMQ